MGNDLVTELLSKYAFLDTFTSQSRSRIMQNDFVNQLITNLWDFMEKIAYFLHNYQTWQRKQKKMKTCKGFQLKIVNPDAAGIDVSSTRMQVYVPLDRDADYNREFGVFTEDLSQKNTMSFIHF
jgi:hypothetical protein